MSGGLDALWDGLRSLLTVAEDQPAFACGALFLAAVFVLSGTPKLRRPELAALAMVDFGVLRRAVRTAGLALGAGELMLALGLMVAAASASSALRSVPTIAAALLLWTFTALIARALRSPERFSCACFGGSGETISARTLARSAALAAVATLLATSAPAEVAPPPLETWVLALVVAACAVGVAGLAATIRPIGQVRS